MQDSSNSANEDTEDLNTTDPKFKGFEHAIKNIQDDVDLVITSARKYENILQGVKTTVETHDKMLEELQALKKRKMNLETISSEAKQHLMELQQDNQSNINLNPSPATSSDSVRKENPLFRNGVCNWPECNASFVNYEEFLKHLKTVHTFNVKSITQSRLQIKKIALQAMQLRKDRDRLSAIMRHLHRKKNITPSVSQESPSRKDPSPVPEDCTSGKHPSPVPQDHPSVNHPHKEVNNASAPGPLIFIDKRKNVAEEIALDRKFYKTTNIQPPVSYAAIIRQAIMESPHQQLKTSGIYNWFESHFSFYLNSDKKWQSSVRKVLATLPYFRHVGIYRPAIWTVDDDEYFKDCTITPRIAEIIQRLQKPNPIVNEATNIPTVEEHTRLLEEHPTFHNDTSQPPNMEENENISSQNDLQIDLTCDSDDETAVKLVTIKSEPYEPEYGPNYACDSDSEPELYIYDVENDSPETKAAIEIMDAEPDMYIVDIESDIESDSETNIRIKPKISAPENDEQVSGSCSQDDNSNIKKE